MRTIERNGHTCHILENGEPEALLFWLMGGHEKDTLLAVNQHIQNLAGKTNWWLAVCEIRDWNAELSPWATPAVFGNEDFGGGGRETLKWIVDVVGALSMEIKKGGAKIIGGYSLAGLFALWAHYETGIFNGAVSCSGSLWFPGWEEYVQSHAAPKNSLIYLSLGKKEEKTRNPVTAKIGDITRGIFERYQTDERLWQVMLEWNEGTHFTEPDIRVAKGFAWILDNI